MLRHKCDWIKTTMENNRHLFYFYPELLSSTSTSTGSGDSSPTATGNWIWGLFYEQRSAVFGIYHIGVWAAEESETSRCTELAWVPRVEFLGYVGGRWVVETPPGGSGSLHKVEQECFSRLWVVFPPLVLSWVI